MAYVYFINSILELEENEHVLTFDQRPSSDQLICHICLEAELNRSPTISSLIYSKELGSPAAVYRKIHQLVDAGLLTLGGHDDRRSKVVLLSDLAVARLEACSRALKQTCARLSMGEAIADEQGVSLTAL